MKHIALFTLMLVSMTLSFALTCYDIQYTTAANGDSPYKNQPVSVQGVVSAIGFSGDKFFITDTVGGAWHGVYVYHFATPVQVGDLVSINATVQEYPTTVTSGVTELGNATVQVLSSGNAVPAPSIIPTNALASAATGEQWEGVIVEVRNASVTQLPNEYQEFYVNDGSGECQIDNNFYELAHLWSGITVGQVYGSIKGAVDYAFNYYSICPRNDSDLVQGTANEDNLNTGVELVGNYPNPFAGDTVIRYNLKNAQKVELNVYNLRGQKVRTLVDGKVNAAYHSVSFDGKDNRGNLLPAGVYMYKLTADNSTQTKKLVIR